MISFRHKPSFVRWYVAIHVRVINIRIVFNYEIIVKDNPYIYDPFYYTYGGNGTGNNRIIKKSTWHTDETGNLGYGRIDAQGING